MGRELLERNLGEKILAAIFQNPDELKRIRADKDVNFENVRKALAARGELRPIGETYLRQIVEMKVELERAPAYEEELLSLCKTP